MSDDQFVTSFIFANGRSVVSLSWSLFLDYAILLLGVLMVLICLFYFDSCLLGR